MIEISLPVWLTGEEVTKLKNAASAWWQQLEDWLALPPSQHDPETCNEKALELLGWERAVDRLPGEPVALYRLRVKHAFANYQDAGTAIGLTRIFDRLGMGTVDSFERLPGRDWDWVQLRVTDQQLHDWPLILSALVRHYGRTCRRYEFLTEETVTLTMRCHEFCDDQLTVLAQQQQQATVVAAINSNFGNDQQTVLASLTS